MIEITNVSKSYGETSALKGVSFVAPSGGCLALIGKNGSGKSTLLRILVGMEIADNGNISYDGVSIGRDFPLSLKLQLGVFLDDNLLIEDLSGYEYLRFVADLYRLPDFDKQIDRYRSLFEFEQEGFTKSPIRDYSMGMRRKIAVISCLFHNPRYLVLDEVFSSLDYDIVSKLITELKGRLPNITLIVTSHVLPYLRELMDTVVVIEDGRVKYCGGPEDLASLQLPFLTTSTVNLNHD